MGLELIGLLAAIAALATALYRVLSRSPCSSADETGLPAELRGARLVHAEETFRSASRRVVARLDRAYEFGGELVLVELKTRKAATVFLADVIELSVQRVALEDQRRVRVSRAAWVITEDSGTGRRQPHPVRLLDAAEVDGLRKRYLAVQAGSAQHPKGARSSRQCIHCGHRLGCASAKG